MRSLRDVLSLYIWVLVCCIVHAKKDSFTVRNIRVNAFDKKLKISNVSTVGELQLKVQQKVGIEPLKQGNVMFGVKRLSPTDVLQQVGVSNGSQINIVPTKASSTLNKVTTAAESPSSSIDADNKTWNKLVTFAVACYNETRRLGKKRWKNDVPQTFMDLIMLVQKVARSAIFEEYMENQPKELYGHIEHMRQMANQRQWASTMSVPMVMQEALKDQVAWRELTLKCLQDIKGLDLDGPTGKRILQDLRMLEASGMLTNKMPPTFYDFMNEPDDDE